MGFFISLFGYEYPPIDSTRQNSTVRNRRKEDSSKRQISAELRRSDYQNKTKLLPRETLVVLRLLAADFATWVPQLL